MEYQIRKLEQDTVFSQSEVAYLDPEVFKDLEYEPYTGDGTSKDFLEYISNVSLDTDFLAQFEMADFCAYSNEEEIKEALADQQIDQQEADKAYRALKIEQMRGELLKIMGDDTSMTEYHRSSEKYEQVSFEVGVEDKSYRKYGGFNGEHIVER